MKVVGIDPGTARLGFALIEGNRRAPVLTEVELITTPINLSPAHRLHILSTALSQRLERIHPDGVAVEKIYFARNSKTAIAVAEARGVILLAAGQAGLKLVEFTPTQVKKRVVGVGHASKRQIQEMTQHQCKLAILPSEDAADALALCLSYAVEHDRLHTRESSRR